MTALRASGALNGRHLTVKTAGFAEKELPGFRAALRLQIENFDPELALSFVNAESGESALYETVVSPGTALDPPSQKDSPELEGSRTGTASLSFLIRWGGKNQRCNLDIRGEKAEFTGAMVRALLKQFQPYGATSRSLFDCVVDEKAKVLDKLKLQNKNIQIRIRTETGTIETGAIMMEQYARPT